MTIVRDIAKGAVWMLVFKLASRSLSIVSIAILARLLSPADFGLVALAMAVIGVFDLATNFSFDIALIQNQEATEDHYNTVWTIGLCFQLAVATCLLLVANPMAEWFDEPNLALAISVLALVPVFEGLQNVRIVDFRKNMRFEKEFSFLMTKKMVGFLVTIPLAFALKSYWALVIGTISSRFAGTVISYVLIPFRPHPGMTKWRELFSFSRWLFLYNILIFMRFRASGFIIGKISGTQGLGVFEISNEVASIPTTELVAPINRAMLPGLSKVSGDLEELGRNYLRIVGMILFVATPAGVGIASIAEPLVHVMLGEKWLDAIPVLGILGIVGALSCTETNTTTTCVTIGRPDLATKLYACYVVILLSLIFLFTRSSGVLGAAWACLIAAAINIPIFYKVLLSALNIRFSRLLTFIWRPVVSSGFMYLCVKEFLATQSAYSGTAEAFPILISAIFLGGAAYLVSATATWHFAGRPEGPEVEILEQIKARLNSRSE